MWSRVDAAVIHILTRQLLKTSSEVVDILRLAANLLRHNALLDIRRHLDEYLC